MARGFDGVGLSLRWKVTLAFGCALAVVLSVAGCFVYLRLDAELDRALDVGLRARVDAVAAALSRPGVPVATGQPADVEADESLTHVLRPDGSIIAASAFGTTSLLTPSQLDRARRGPVVAERTGDTAIDEHLRLLAAPALRADGSAAIVVVGTSLDEKRQALRSLAIIGSTALLGALLAGSLVGYIVAGAALRPVEIMRQQAEAIQSESNRRLQVPRTRDEISRLGVTLNAMLDRLEAASRAEEAALAQERRFVADASHELRTPLTIMKTEIDVALMSGSTEDDLRSALHSTAEETDRLVRLVDDLLVLARADERRLCPRQQTLNLRTLCHAVVDEHRGRPLAAGRRIAVSITGEPTISADPDLLRLAVGNLLDNALRHARGHVVLRAAHHEAGTRLWVTDGGPGMPTEFLGHAFDRFTQASAGRTGVGTGLGLSIVKAIAEAHGGQVFAIRRGPGSAVGLWLPDNESTPHADARAGHASSPTPTANPLAGTRR